MRVGFDSDRYMETQTEQILKRVAQFNDKLYLEFGGKIFDDDNMARIMPGFPADGKIRLLEKLKDRVEIIICVSAPQIEQNKMRGTHSITYDMEVLRLVDGMRKMGLLISSIVITMYSNQPSAEIFRKKLERCGEKVYIHRPIEDYPNNVDYIISDKGFGTNPYIRTTRNLVVVTGPGPGSGKLGTCLSQLYHERVRGVKAGYAKFETLPIWNLPLNHPVNLAYEAATADLDDYNMIDPFHLEAYRVQSVNYNRDIDAFPILREMLTRLIGEDTYKSPTDMGVNMAGLCIADDAIVREAAKQEILRRYFWTQVYYKEGRNELRAVQKIEQIMAQAGLETKHRKAVAPALEKARKSNSPAMSLILQDGRGQVITARTTDVLAAASNLVLNSIKALAGIPDDIHLISPSVLEPMLMLKKEILHDKNPLVSLEEVLNALAICAATSGAAKKALSCLPSLRNCEAHSSHIISKSDEMTLKKLGINVTCTPEFSSKDLF